MADWSTLPGDILHKVATYIIAVEDFLAFSAVCWSWRSVYSAKRWNQVPQVPLLMSCENENSSVRDFVSLCTNKVYKLDLPEARGSRCWGSSLGWFVTLTNNLEIHLLNPFTRVSIDLPPKSSLHIHFGEILDWFDIIEKAFVFKKPCENESDLLVMIIYGPLRQLAFCRPGYRAWNSIEDVIHSGFIDVSFVKDQIIALSNMGSLVLVDIDGRSVIDSKCLHAPERMTLSFPQWDWEQLFLVESSDDLLMVHQNGNRRGSSIESIEFIVYYYDFNKKRWIRLSHLGDRTVFVGDNCCVCVHAPHRFNCKSNCVYFIGKDMERRWPNREIHVDVGVYDLADGRCEPLWRGNEFPRHYTFPIWAVPTLS